MACRSSRFLAWRKFDFRQAQHPNCLLGGVTFVCNFAIILLFKISVNIKVNLLVL